MLIRIPEKGRNETRKKDRRIDDGLRDAGDDKRRNYEQICTNVVKVTEKPASTTVNEGNMVFLEILSCVCLRNIEIIMNCKEQICIIN